MTLQQVQEELDRAIKLSRTNTMTSTEFTNSATDRAGKVLGFDSAGELNVTAEIGSNKGDWSAGTAYVVRDIVKDTSTNNIFMINTAHTSSGSEPLTTNANSAKYDLLVDAASATTSATNAAASATAAASSATTAASSASTATTQASNASTSATNAATSATSAETAKTAAQAAQAAAETAADNFDDTYLGAKSSDPTVDNDGDALTAGDLYFNTTTNRLRVYTGSAWVEIDAGMTSFTLAGSSGSNQTITNGNTLTIAAGTGITTTGGSTDTVTIAVTDDPTALAIALG
jgi:hypothetical protein